MKSKLILICALFILFLSLASCSTQTTVTVSCDDFMKQRHVNTQIQVSVGDSLNVNLCSNATTGFRWSEVAEISSPEIIKQTAHKFIGPSEKGGTPPPPGTAGTEVWTFEALKRGTSTIYMEYSRPWAGGEKGEWTFKLTAVVK